jgi:hypothetical protein
MSPRTEQEQREKKQTKRDWLNAWLDGMERGGFTGEAMPRLHFNNGVLTRVIPMREDSTT